MDTSECQPLYFDIQEFYEGLNMKVEQQIPLLLVERQALNEALEGEKNVRQLDDKIKFEIQVTSLVTLSSCFYIIYLFFHFSVYTGPSSCA